MVGARPKVEIRASAVSAHPLISQKDSLLDFDRAESSPVACHSHGREVPHEPCCWPCAQRLFFLRPGKR